MVERQASTEMACNAEKKLAPEDKGRREEDLRQLANQQRPRWWWSEQPPPLLCFYRCSYDWRWRPGVVRYRMMIMKILSRLGL
jgi:hypothetical protein